MDAHAHWNHVYAGKSVHERSWYRPHLDVSLTLVRCITPDLSMPILDAGAGESTLVDDLLAAGYTDISLLDISEQALDHTRARLGPRAGKVTFLAANLLTIQLPQHSYGIWHDRAVFHFLTDPADREAYVAQVVSAVRPGGHIILAAFAPDGPTRCSGLPVMRHDPDSILREFGSRASLASATTQLHTTPSGAVQPFVYCDLLLV